MKAQLLTITSAISLSVVLAACNHNMSANPVKKYPDLKDAVPIEQRVEPRKQHVQTDNNVEFTLKPNQVLKFAAGTESTFDFSVKVYADKNGLKYNVAFADGTPEGLTLKLVREVPFDQGIEQFYKISWTPSDALTQARPSVSFDTRVIVQVKSWGTTPQVIANNEKMLVNQTMDRQIRLEVVRGQYKPVIVLQTPARITTFEGDEAKMIVVVRDESANGLTKLPSLKKEKGQPVTFRDDFCREPLPEIASIGEPARKSQDPNLYSFEVTVKAPSPAPQAKARDCTTPAKSQTSYVGFDLVATSADGLPSSAVPVPVDIATREENLKPVIVIAQPEKFIPGKAATSGQIQISVVKGPLKIDMDGLTKQFRKIGTTEARPVLKIIAKTETSATLAVAWNPPCEKSEDVTVTIKAEANGKATTAELRLQSDNSVEICKKNPKPAPAPANQTSKKTGVNT